MNAGVDLILMYEPSGEQTERHVGLYPMGTTLEELLAVGDLREIAQATLDLLIQDEPQPRESNRPCAIGITSRATA